MGFRDLFKILDFLAFRNAPTRKSLMYVVGDDDASTVPVTAGMLTGSGGTGGGSDPASARETTLKEVRDRLPVRPTAILGRQTLALTNVAQPLTVPAGATGADIGVRGGHASVAFAAPAPTATAGRLLPDGGSWRLEAYELSALRAVIATGAPVLDVTYLGAAAAGTGSGATPGAGDLTVKGSDAFARPDRGGYNVWCFDLGSGTASSLTMTSATDGLSNWTYAGQRNSFDCPNGSYGYGVDGGRIYLYLGTSRDISAQTYTFRVAP